jgi:hypothetical protein
MNLSTLYCSTKKEKTRIETAKTEENIQEKEKKK